MENGGLLYLRTDYKQRMEEPFAVGPTFRVLDPVGRPAAVGGEDPGPRRSMPRLPRSGRQRGSYTPSRVSGGTGTESEVPEGIVITAGFSTFCHYEGVVYESLVVLRVPTGDLKGHRRVSSNQRDW